MATKPKNETITAVQIPAQAAPVPSTAHALQPQAQVFIPSEPVLRKQTYAAPMSYIGSARRIVAWVKRVGAAGPLQTALAVFAAVAAMFVMWAVVTVWYFITLVIFGWFMVPFRLIRRSGRKQEHIQRTQLATMQAMMIQQQQAMIQNNQGR